MAVTLNITGTISFIGELRQAGKSQCIDLCIPEDKYYKGNSKTEWHYITCWGKDAENAAEHLAKGSVISADCDITYNQSKDGKRFTNINVSRIEYLAFFGKNKKAA